MSTTNSPGPIPAFEWVFACNTVLGNVATGHRDTRGYGGAVRYVPDSNLRHGLRWCSTEWLDRRLGRRGFVLRTQSGLSRMCMQATGIPTGAMVMVIPDDQIETAVALADAALRDHGEPAEWSTALVREPGRTRTAVRFARATQPWELFGDELDIEYFVEIGEGPWTSDKRPGTDQCIVRAPDGSPIAEREGALHLENEPIPAALVELAERWGTGLVLRGGTTPVILTAGPSGRPLEPDEEATDHDISRWMS